MGKYSKRPALREKKKALMVKEHGGKCQRCGYKKCLRALQFHHIDPIKKDFHFSQGKDLKLSSIKKELEKCELLCANCHAEEHDK